MRIEDLQKCARAAYERWGVSYNGMLLPWNKLSESERATWRAIAEETASQVPAAPVPVLGPQYYEFGKPAQVGTVKENPDAEPA